jgi:hypothetical protein
LVSFVSIPLRNQEFPPVSIRRTDRADSAPAAFVSTDRMRCLSLALIPHPYARHLLTVPRCPAYAEYLDVPPSPGVDMVRQYACSYKFSIRAACARAAICLADGHGRRSCATRAMDGRMKVGNCQGASSPQFSHSICDLLVSRFGKSKILKNYTEIFLSELSLYESTTPKVIVIVQIYEKLHGNCR